MLKNYFFRPFLIIAVVQLIFACSDKADVQKSQEKPIDKSIED